MRGREGGRSACGRSKGMRELRKEDACNTWNASDLLSSASLIWDRLSMILRLFFVTVALLFDADPPIDSYLTTSIKCSYHK